MYDEGSHVDKSDTRANRLVYELVTPVWPTYGITATPIYDKIPRG